MGSSPLQGAGAFHDGGASYSWRRKEEVARAWFQELPTKRWEFSFNVFVKRYQWRNDLLEAIIFACERAHNSSIIFTIPFSRF
jgi:hypothetical protein